MKENDTNDGKQVTFAGIVDSDAEKEVSANALVSVVDAGELAELHQAVKDLKEFGDISSLIILFLLMMAGMPMFEDVLPNERLQKRFVELQAKYFVPKPKDPKPKG